MRHLGSWGEVINTCPCSATRLTKKLACRVYSTDAANLNPGIQIVCSHLQWLHSAVSASAPFSRSGDDQLPPQSFHATAGRVAISAHSSVQLKRSRRRASLPLPRHLPRWMQSCRPSSPQLEEACVSVKRWESVFSYLSFRPSFPPS